MLHERQLSRIIHIIGFAKPSAAVVRSSIAAASLVRHASRGRHVLMFITRMAIFERRKIRELSTPNRSARGSDELDESLPQPQRRTNRKYRLYKYQPVRCL